MTEADTYRLNDSAEQAALPTLAKSHQTGHRQRLRDRFMKAGRDALADYEMLELLLFMAIPRSDVKPLAKDLMQRFGSYADVVSAPPEQLKQVKGVGDTVITALKIIEASVEKLAQERILDRPVISSWQALLDYLQISMGAAPREQFRVLYLNKKNIIIADEAHQTGTVDQAAVYPREVIRRALELAATAIILVHNHPSGDTKPSQADIRLTRDIVSVTRPLGIAVHDHVIIARNKHTSFKSLGLL